MIPGIPRIYGWLAGAAVLGLVAIGIFIHLRGDAHLQDKYEALTGQAGAVLAATRIAADNPELQWQGTAGQVIALGNARREALARIAVQNRAIDEMAREAVAAQARAAELQEIARKAEAQRQSALRRLSDMAITPGTRADCLTLLEEAEEALDLVREAGL